MPDPDLVIDGTIREWRDVLLRLQQMTRNDQGATVVEVKILCERGRPQFWFAPTKHKVEPASAARFFCSRLDGGPGT